MNKSDIEYLIGLLDTLKRRVNFRQRQAMALGKTRPSGVLTEIVDIKKKIELVEKRVENNVIDSLIEGRRAIYQINRDMEGFEHRWLSVLESTTRRRLLGIPVLLYIKSTTFSIWLFIIILVLLLSSVILMTRILYPHLALDDWKLLRFNLFTVTKNEFGDGRDGDLTITSGQRVTINNLRTNITASGTDVETTNSEGFAAGDMVLFHQTQGIDNVGHWEIDQIASINSSTNWTLADPLTYTYNNIRWRAQAIKVPQFRNVIVQVDGVLTASEWDGSTGGVLVFLANGEVDVSGLITMSGKGFKGGAGNEAIPVFCTNSRRGQQGHSPIGTGGCSQSSNLGGGGGGSEGDGDSNWGAGGGGGYGSPGGDGTGPFPGIGGAPYGVDDLSLLNLGSGGGGGAWGTNPYGGGRNTIEGNDFVGQGGGAILVFAEVVTDFNASADGNSGGNSVNSIFGGYAGGGGSGGSIKIFGRNITIGNVSATGGANGVGTLGNGGNGGIGRIRIEYCDTLSGSIIPRASVQQVTCQS